MDIEEIRKNKPEGATQYLVTIHGNVIYAKWMDDGRVECFYTDVQKWKIPIAQNCIKLNLKPL